MSDMLGISGNAIGAYQRALSTVSNNIANVNTEGYSRQDVVLKDTAPSKAANMFLVPVWRWRRSNDSSMRLPNRTCATAPVTWRPKNPWWSTPSG